MKIEKLLEQSEEQEIIVVAKGDIINKFKEFVEAIGTRASHGTGISIVAEDNGGEEVSKIYIDGDGADRISLKK